MALRRYLALIFVAIALFPLPARGQVPNDRVASGSLTAAWNGVGIPPPNSVVVIALPAQGTAGVQLTGTFVGTVAFEVLIDQRNATWIALPGTPLASGASITTAAAPGAWLFSIAGTKQFRVRCSVYTSGTIQVGIVGSQANAPNGVSPTGSQMTDSNTSSSGFNPGPAQAQQALQFIYNAASNVWVGVRSANNLVDNAAGGTIPGSTNNLFNGPAIGSGGFDPERGNIQAVVQAPAVTTAGTVNKDITIFNHGYLIVHANVTLYNGGSVLIKAQMQDANGTFTDLPGATTGVVTSGADLFLVVGANAWPANTAANFYANFPLPRLVRIVTTIATASVTLSSAYSLQK